MSKRDKPSLEQKLLELAYGSDPRDREKKSRVERLASMLWTRTLDGDRDALKQLLERLPQQQHPYPEPETVPKVVETYTDVVAALRALVASGLVPAQTFRNVRPGKARGCYGAVKVTGNQQRSIQAFNSGLSRAIYRFEHIVSYNSGKVVAK